ncbi:MAG TPA: PAS domain S-box protein [Candidatus Thermoplasmatota archaeon]|nr:PAS domain S-box protein [Candidatus Thermoplasmatota archaeon]
MAPFQALVEHALTRSEAPASHEPMRGSTADLQPHEVVGEFVQAELKGEQDRSKLLYMEAERRGAAGQASRLALDALSWQNRILELVARQAPLDETLQKLAVSVEAQFPDAMVAILLVDTATSRLRVRVAPSMPADYAATLDDLPLTPPGGPCATAVEQKRRVIVTDFNGQPDWAKARDAALRQGVQSWWSLPILTADGTCRGTFALHSRAKRVPNAHELQLLDVATSLARLAWDSHEHIAARRDVEVRMSSIVASALDAIVSMDAQGNVVEWNPSAERIFGYTRAHALGRPMAELIIPPESRKAHWAGLSRYLATGEARVIGRKIELTALRADGGTFPIELAIVRLATDGPPTFTGFIRDLTHRVRQAEELRASNEHLRAIFEQVAVGVAEFDLQGRFKLVNDRYCQIAGRSRSELLALAVGDVTAADHVKKDQDLFDAVRATGRDAITDSRFNRPDGTHVWVRRSLSLIRDAQGKPALIVGVIQEITEQKEAEERLRTLNATLDARVKERTKALEDAKTAIQTTASLLKNVLDNTPDSVYVKDLTGHYLLANPAMHAALGRKPGTIVGLDGSSWMAPEVFAATRADDARVIASGTTINTEYTFNAKGQQFTFNTIKVPYRDPAGNIIGVLAVSRDVSQRKQAEEALQKIDRFKTQFINTAAHELRTPLLPLRMQLDLLMTDQDHPAVPSHLQAMEVMSRNLDRLGGLVEDLLLVARSQAGRLQLDLAATDVAKVLHEVEQTFQAMAVKRGIRLTVEGGSMPPVLADGQRIGQVVTNLLSNAFKFTPDGGHVSVRVQPEGPGVRVTVEDTGIGIAPEHLDKLFQPFVQVHDVAPVVQPGSGLGLYICKQMIELHGGAIGCRSPGPGKGSTFWFTLPGLPPRPASDDRDATWRFAP